MRFERISLQNSHPYTKRRILREVGQSTSFGVNSERFVISGYDAYMYQRSCVGSITKAIISAGYSTQTPDRYLILCFFQNYLRDRSQFVSIEEKRSTSRPLTFRVPQGSVLGPLLYSLNCYWRHAPSHCFFVVSFHQYFGDRDM